jgi:hypothetical protein
MSCSFARLVEAHFALRLAPEEEARLRAHLPTCAECTQHYERRHLLAQLTPEAAGPEARLGAALGFAPPRRVPRVWWAAALVPVAAALALLVWLQAPAPDEGFTPRGGDAGTVAWLEVYRLAAAKAPEPNPTRVAASDALAFAYRNPEAHAYFMLFGVDARGQVHWYFPEWTDATNDPSAVGIAAGHELRELKAAVTQPLAPGGLKLHALFLDAPRTVKAVEAAWSAKQPLVSAREREVTFDLEVTP